MEYELVIDDGNVEHRQTYLSRRALAPALDHFMAQKSRLFSIRQFRIDDDGTHHLEGEWERR